MIGLLIEAAAAVWCVVAGWIAVLAGRVIAGRDTQVPGRSS